jgi:hypothetical protein
MEEVQILIDKLNFNNPFSTKEFVKYDKSEITDKMISDEEILKAILSDQEDEREEDSLSPIITSEEVIEAYDKVILYLKQQEKSFGVKKEELRSIKKLRKEALKQQFVSSK